MIYIKLFYDWPEGTSALSYEEKGRLLDAMVIYARDGVVPDLPGNERILFPVFRNQIDRDRAGYARTCEENARSREEDARSREDKAQEKDEAQVKDQVEAQEENKAQEKAPSVSRERNEHWRTSIMARKAEAQRLVDACISEKLPCRGLKDLFDQILQAMENGLSPGKILDCCRRSEAHTLGLELYIAMKDRGLKPE